MTNFYQVQQKILSSVNYRAFSLLHWALADSYTNKVLENKTTIERARFALQAELLSVRG